MTLTAMNGQQFDLEEYLAGVGPGWHNLVRELVVDLLALGWDGHLYQLKEKYGTLRFYIGGGTDEVYARITKAERDSAHICEQCGKPGRLRGGGWVVTECDECNAPRERAGL